MIPNNISFWCLYLGYNWNSEFIFNTNFKKSILILILDDLEHLFLEVMFINRSRAVQKRTIHSENIFIL